METMRARNGSTQFGYSAPFDGIQFSDPWARANPTTSSQMLASTLAQDTSGMPSMSRPMRQDSMYQGSFNTAGSYAGQSAGSPQGNGAYGMGGYSQSYDQSANRNLYSLQSPVHNTDRRLSQPSHHYPQTSVAPPQPSSFNMGSPVEMRQRQNSLVDYPRTQSNTGSFTATGRDHYDTLDSARGMVAMSQAPRHSMSAMTSAPRTASTASTASYYPASTSSSISSASSYPYFGSMDSSSTELSSTDGMFDSARPSLPRPAGMISSNMLPHQSGQATMMSTFSSRVSSSTQKKHKCKICDKRFTRPSSLQTHMYSHTGEKPFACDVEGCGRQFSVVSNLRRHRKVHKGLTENQDNGCSATA
jgi:hypothetical protein